MNRLLLAGLVVGLITVFTYIAIALNKKKKPELSDGIIIFLSAVSVLGAIRLIGFVFTEQFAAIAKNAHTGSLWELSSEDAALIVVGGLALAWVSVQSAVDSFTKLYK